MKPFVLHIKSACVCLPVNAEACFYLLCILAFGYSCSEKPPKQTEVLTEQMLSIATDTLSNTKDEEPAALPTGIPIPAHGRWVSPDSIAPAKSVPLSGNPIVRPAHADIIPAGSPEVRALSAPQTVITPGKNNIPLPKKVLAKGKIVAAAQPRPVPAPPLRFKDAATSNLQYFNIELGQGFNHVNAICQDRRGHMWFGTSAGVIWYDGKNMAEYTEKEGLGSDQVTCIMEDSRGYIWFVFFGGGVTCYDGINFTHFTEKEGLSSNLVYSCLEDSRGNLWFGTYQGGVCRYDGKEFTHYTQKEGLSDDSVLSIFEDSHGNLWFGTLRGGVCRFDGEHFTHFNEEGGLSSNLVYCIKEDNNGKIWFGTYKGAIRYDGTTFTYFTEREGLIGRMVTLIVEDREGYIWFVNKDSGAVSKSAVTRFDGKSFVHFTENEGLSDNRIYSLLIDSAGDIWFGTLNGVSRFCPNSFINFTEKNGLNHEQMVFSILEDRQGDLWLGTWAGGLIRYNGDNFTYFGQREGLRTGVVNQSILDNQGHLWFDHGGIGVTRFDGQRFTHFAKSNQHINLLTPLMADGLNGLWFASDGGVIHRAPEGDTVFFEQEGLQNARYHLMLKDRHAHYWFGTAAEGVVKYDGVAFTRYTEKEGLANNHIYAMIEDRHGRLWFATDGGGVSCFDGQRFTNYTEKEGLGGNRVYSLKEDKLGRIWMSWYGGISLLVPDSGEVQPSSGHPATSAGRFRIFNFGQMDGLKGRRYAAVCLDQKNQMWWGGEKGMTMLDLNHFELPCEPPVVQLNHIEIEQQFIDYRRLSDKAYQNTLRFGKKLSQAIDSVIPFHNYPVSMTLPPDLNNLTFHFSAIDWTAPHKIQYSYFMETVDKDWSTPQTDPKADYKNLHAGTFTLHVKALGGAQIWSKPYQYTFVIQSPWYQSLWAYFLYAVAIGGLLFTIRRYELRQVKARSEALRLKELDLVKSHLYTNITHEFRTPLTVILGMASLPPPPSKGGGDVASTPPLEGAGGKLDLYQRMQLIKRNGQQLLHLVNQLLDLAKIESGNMPMHFAHGDIVAFLKYLSESFHSYADSKDIRLHFLSEMTEQQMDYDAEKIQMVVSNLLSNAIRFTPSGGDIYFQVAVRHRVQHALNNDPASLSLICEIKDNGIGIDAKYLPYIFDRFYQVHPTNTHMSKGTGIGLSLSKELVKLMGGDITVESELGKGSKFTIILPVLHVYKDKLQDRLSREATTLGTIIIPDETNMEVMADSISTSKRPLVLLVEDNPDVITYLTTLLLSEYDLVTATNGQAGINKAIEFVPDLVVSDVMMPEKDGFEVCETLKSDERTSHIPIILLTAKADQSARIEGLAHGADAYLAKPFHKEELLIRIEKLIELRRQLQFGFGKSAGSAKMPLQKLPVQEEEFLQKLIGIVEAHLSDENFGMPELCKQAGMSRTQLFRKLKALTGKSATRFIRSIRLEKARGLLETTDLSISEVAYQTGFGSAAYFSRIFQEEFGVAPSAMWNR